MVTVARYLNVTLIVPELDKTSFWADPRSAFLLHSLLHLQIQLRAALPFCCFVCSEFQDRFDVDYFIASLREEVRILKKLPPRLKRRVEQGFLRSMPPVSWSDISYYHNQVCFASLPSQ